MAQNLPLPPSMPPSDGDYSVRYILQDANYNVVGVVRDCDKTVIQQYAYKPYGELLAVEDADGNAVDLTSSPNDLITNQLFQGLELNQETGQYVAGIRIVDPPIGRFLQPDPNGQALMLGTAMAMNGQTQLAFVSLSPRGQYTDGQHLYQFVGSNPITQTDPSGQFITLVLAPILGALGGAAYEAASIYSSAADLDMSAGQILLQVVKSAGIGAVMGIGAHAAALGLGAGIGGAGGLQLGYSALGTMFGPLIAGKGIARYRSATEEWDRVMALVDIGSGALATVGGFAGAMSRGAEFAFLSGGRGFRSFAALKRSLGPAGPGKAWHHIVEQHPANIAKFGAEAIHNTRNVIRLPSRAGQVHDRITGHYSSKPRIAQGLTVRKWLSTKSFDAHYQYGMKILRKFGGSPSQIGR